MKLPIEWPKKSTFEFRVQRAGGEYFWVSGILERTFDENGETVFVAAFHDVTEEKLAEQEAEREILQERITLVGAISNAYPVIISINLTRGYTEFYLRKTGPDDSPGAAEIHRLFQDMALTVHPEHANGFRHRFGK